MSSSDIPTQAESYVVVHKQEDLLPSKHYRGLILEAAIEHEFPDDYIAMLKAVPLQK